VQPCTSTQSIDRLLRRWLLVEQWCRLRLAVWGRGLAVAASFGTCCMSGNVWSQVVPWNQAEMTIASGAETKPADDKSLVALAQLGTVTFRETPLAEVILILSEQWDVNIIAGADVQGQVNGTFKNESLKSILDSILLSNGLQYRQVGNSLVVLPNADLGSNRTNFQVEVLDVHVTSSEEMDELIAALRLQMSAEGQLVPVNSTGKLTLLDAPERIVAVKTLLAQLVPAAQSNPPQYVSTPAGQVAPFSAADSGGQFSGANSQLGAVELRPQFILASDLIEPLRRIVGEDNITLVGGGGDGGAGAMGGGGMPMGGGSFGGSSLDSASLGGSALGGGSLGGLGGGGGGFGGGGFGGGNSFGAGGSSLVVFGDSATLKRAELMMYQLDKPRPQVRITGYIYDVDVGELEKLGVDWGQRTMSTGLDANGVPNNLAMSGTGLLTPSAITNSANTLSGVVTDTASTTAGAAAATTAAGPVGGQFLFRTLSSGFELQALVQALEQTKGSRLLADPHITVVDRQLATFEAKTKIPIQQLTQTQQGGAIGSTSFVDAGISLVVTPRIANDGTIEMQLSPSFSALVGFDKDGKPIIDERNASTVVRVNHGQALAIGGLRKKNTVETVKGIPGLMNIKYLGALFRTHDTDVRESELLVFIMPEIVGYCGGLPREMAALEVAQAQLSRISTAVDGPVTPDCKDKHCPNHHERPRIHNGMHDAGLIGSYDPVFFDSLTPLNLSVDAAPSTNGVPSVVQPAVPVPEVQFESNLPSVPAASSPPSNSPLSNSPLSNSPLSNSPPLSQTPITNQSYLQAVGSSRRSAREATTLRR
jgi:general secretion pathway protein D